MSSGCRALDLLHSRQACGRRRAISKWICLVYPATGDSTRSPPFYSKLLKRNKILPSKAGSSLRAKPLLSLVSRKAPEEGTGAFFLPEEQGDHPLTLKEGNKLKKMDKLQMQQ